MITISKYKYFYKLKYRFKMEMDYQNKNQQLNHWKKNRKLIKELDPGNL